MPSFVFESSSFYCTTGVNFLFLTSPIYMLTSAALHSFQIEKIDREITDYLDTNNKMNTYHFEYCPKCGCYHPRLIKSGFANSGKQMLRCKECGKRFVYISI